MIIDRFRIVRRFKKGHWVKTIKRGWLEFWVYEDYLSYGFDPVVIDEEEY